MSDDDFYDISPISNFVDSEIPSNKEPKYDWIMSKFCSSNLELLSDDSCYCNYIKISLFGPS